MKAAKIIKKILMIIIGIIVVLLLAWLAFYFHRSKPSQVQQYETLNPHVRQETGISAHRSGAGIMPEQTLMAIRSVAENEDYQVDYFEFDLHLTQDGQLVLLHDDVLDRTSDSKELFGVSDVQVGDKSLEELKQLNMGAKFVADDGSMPFAGLASDEVPDELRIATLTEALDYLSSAGNYNYILEIKDAGERGYQAVDQLYKVLTERDMLENTMVGSFNDEVMNYMDEAYADVYRVANVSETIQFAMASLLNKKNYDPDFKSLALPYHSIVDCYGVNLGLAKVINYAHAHDLSVSYWTINDEKDMEYLRSIGADLITTDYPNVLADLLANE